MYNKLPFRTQIHQFLTQDVSNLVQVAAPFFNLIIYEVFRSEIIIFNLIFVSISSVTVLKGPKHDQIECGFFYINPTSMGW